MYNNIELFMVKKDRRAKFNDDMIFRLRLYFRDMKHWAIVDRNYRVALKTRDELKGYLRALLNLNIINKKHYNLLIDHTNNMIYNNLK